MHTAWLATMLSVCMPTCGYAQQASQPRSVGDGFTPVGQLLRPAGEVLSLPGVRPVDLLVARDGGRVYIKGNGELLVLSSDAANIEQRLKYPAGGASMTGLAESPDGRRVYVTNSASELFELELDDSGRAAWGKTYKLPAPSVGGAAFGCGVALTPDGGQALVCSSRGNELVVIDLLTGEVAKRIDVGIAPFDVAIAPDGGLAFVSNWGGQRPGEGDGTAPTAGSPARVDERGIAASGTVSIVDLREGISVAELDVGLSPSEIVLSPDQTRLYVACSNNDHVAVIDTAKRTVTDRIDVKPDASLPFGSMPAALTLSEDGKTLYVANAGNNAVAVVALEARPTVTGFIPTGWLPGAVTVQQGRVFIANIRGMGSRQARGDGAFNSHRHVGTIQVAPLPTEHQLAEMTSQCLADARVPRALRAMERQRSGVAPKAVPERAGEPSVFEHVVYIIKENRTYDQVFGDMAAGDNPKGDGMPELCIFGREVTPNQHALVDQFVLLDNYYCNGVLSADGHSWATEGNVTPYLERSFGGFARSYTFGDDPLTYSSSGFIWDHVLAAGLSFRNYGEFDYTSEKPDSSFPQILEDWTSGERKIRFEHNIGVENVRRYSNPDSPGWNMDIPDQIRADVFLEEFAKFEQNGDLPNFIIIYLPNDHTSGTGEGNPTPRALVADNDLAVGRIVDTISHSQFWKKTCIFINEDDPQNGWDHVDGHRSICLVVSPYTKRGEVVSNFANQSGVVHTIERILGVPGANQRYMLAPVMDFCFNDQPDFTPFDHLPGNIDLTEMNPSKTSLGPVERHWAEVSEAQDLAHVDAADEDEFNRVLWHAMKGVDVPYPVEFAGAHGRGLGERGLMHVEFEDDDDD